MKRIVLCGSKKFKDEVLRIGKELEKRGKKRMRQIGSVEMPQEAFLSVLKLDDES